jgi:hypothetical protein
VIAEPAERHAVDDVVLGRRGPIDA